MTDNALPRLLSEQEAAAYLGVKPRTLARLRLAGKIEYVRISERRFSYLEEQLLNYLNLKEILVRAKSCVASREPKPPVQRRHPPPLVMHQQMFPKPRRRKVSPG